MNIWIAALLGVIVGIVLGIIIHWAASGGEDERKVHDLKNEAVGLFMERQVEINELLLDFYKSQVEANIISERRIETITLELNALKQDPIFRPKVRDSFFQKEEGNQ